MPSCCEGDDIIFPQQAWDIKARLKECKEKYNVQGEPYAAIDIYGGDYLNAASNIIFRLV